MRSKAIYLQESNKTCVAISNDIGDGHPITPWISVSIGPASVMFNCDDSTPEQLRKLADAVEEMLNETKEAK